MEGNYMLLAIPVFLLLIVFEWLVARHKKKEAYRLNDTVTNLNLGVGNVVMSALTKTFFVGIYTYAYEHFRFMTISPGILSWVICLVAYDFAFYWAHRISHERNIFWGAHVVHHQSEYFNLSVALRQSWIHNLLVFFLFMPIPFFGLDPITFFTAASLNTFYQFWIHTEAINKMPRWFELIFNTPAHHRVHHGINPKYIDKNHAGMFIIWDRMFGTFQQEEETPTYGITKPLESWNPIWSNLHYYVDMFRDASQMSRISDKLKLIFARPGWRPEENGGMRYPQEVDQTTYVRFDKNTPNKGLRAYVVVQLLITIVGLSGFLYYFDTLNLYYKAWGFLMIMLTLGISGAIMEQRTWVKYAEYIRLIMVVAGLNVLYFSNFREWFEIMLAGSLIAGAYFVTWFTLDAIVKVRRRTLSDLFSKSIKS